MSYAADFHNGNPAPRDFVAHGPGGNIFVGHVRGTPARPFLPDTSTANAHGVDLFQQLLRRGI
jgi:hypothetical protein